MEKLSQVVAKQRITSILKDGSIAWKKHAFEEMAKDNLSTQDALNVLRAGVVQPPDYKDGSWRYRVCTYKITVVIAFRGETELVVITAWRDK